MTQYVIGFGTGRCGTMSLARLLNGCQGVNVFHEMGTIENLDDILPWEFDVKFADKKYLKFKKLQGEIVGDVGLYYLNYLGYFFENLSNLKAVYMWRNEKDVIKSYLRKTGSLNHWWSEEKNKKAGYVPVHRWNRAYPKFDNTSDKHIAIQEYCRLYYKLAEELKGKYPKKVMMINVKNLNNPVIQEALFDFIEIPKSKRVYQTIIANKLVTK